MALDLAVPSSTPTTNGTSLRVRAAISDSDALQCSALWSEKPASCRQTVTQVRSFAFLVMGSSISFSLDMAVVQFFGP